MILCWLKNIIFAKKRLQMRDLVARRSFLLRKHLDNFLYRIIPSKWVPLYTSVTFTRMRYHQCISNKKWQDEVRIQSLACHSTTYYMAFIPFLSAPWENGWHNSKDVFGTWTWWSRMVAIQWKTTNKSIFWQDQCLEMITNKRLNKWAPRKKNWQKKILDMTCSVIHDI